MHLRNLQGVREEGVKETIYVNYTKIQNMLMKLSNISRLRVEGLQDIKHSSVAYLLGIYYVSTTKPIFNIINLRAIEENSDVVRPSFNGTSFNN